MVRSHPPLMLWSVPCDGSLTEFVLQVGYGVPAALCALIGFKPHLTGTETRSHLYLCLFTVVKKMHYLLRMKMKRFFTDLLAFWEFLCFPRFTNSWTLIGCSFPVLKAPSSGCVMSVHTCREKSIACVFLKVCFLRRDFALEACCRSLCDDIQCCYCHVRMEAS